jgi:pimeloyl-ACP methyl ester carboxylesterase
MTLEPPARARIRRGFADVAEGQVHYREAGQSAQGGLPLLMLHASPGSAKLLEPLMGELGRRRRVVATDTLGNGDSSPRRTSAISPMRMSAPVTPWAWSALTCTAAIPAPASLARSPLRIRAASTG